MRFALRIGSARIVDMAVCMGTARERRPRCHRRCNANEAAIKNVKQGYPLSQLAFRAMTRKTQDVRYCKTPHECADIRGAGTDFRLCLLLYSDHHGRLLRCCAWGNKAPLKPSPWGNDFGVPGFQRATKRWAFGRALEVNSVRHTGGIEMKPSTENKVAGFHGSCIGNGDM